MTIPEKAYRSIKKKRRRTADETRKESIEILTMKEYTITQFMMQINLNYRGTKKLLQELIDDGIVQTRDKRSSGMNKICKHYRVEYKETYNNDAI